MCIEHSETVIFIRTLSFYRVLPSLSPCQLVWVHWAFALSIRTCSPHFNNPGEKRLLTEQGVKIKITWGQRQVTHTHRRETQDWCEEGRKNLNTKGSNVMVGAKPDTRGHNLQNKTGNEQTKAPNVTVYMSFKKKQHVEHFSHICCDFVSLMLLINLLINDQSCGLFRCKKKSSRKFPREVTSSNYFFCPKYPNSQI